MLKLCHHLERKMFAGRESFELYTVEMQKFSGLGAIFNEKGPLLKKNVSLADQHRLRW